MTAHPLRVHLTLAVALKSRLCHHHFLLPLQNWSLPLRKTEKRTKKRSRWLLRSCTRG